MKVFLRYLITSFTCFLCYETNLITSSFAYNLKCYSNHYKYISFETFLFIMYFCQGYKQTHYFIMSKTLKTDPLMHKFGAKKQNSDVIKKLQKQRGKCFNSTQFLHSVFLKTVTLSNVDENQNMYRIIDWSDMLKFVVFLL